MAIIVTFSVTYSLIMPAITVSRDQADEIAGLYLDDSEEVFDIVEDGGDEDELWTSEDTVIQHAGAMEDDWDGILIEEETEDETEETGSGIELEEPAQSENLNAHYTYEQELSTDTEAETTAAIELDSEDEEETETESQIEISVETESETEVETESETESETEIQTESETESETEIQTESEIHYPAQRFTASEGGVLIIVNAPESAFPEGTTMTVSHVNDKQTLKGIEEAAQTDEKHISRIEAVDICFRDADGNEIEPKAPVSVCMITENKASKEDPVVVHVDDDGHAETVQDAEVYTTGTHDQIVLTANGSAANQAEAETEKKEINESSATAAKTAIEFETEQFSIYAVVYTVDFEYSVNGKMYQFSLPGGGFVSFTDLVEVLGINGNTSSDENGVNEGAEESGINAGTNTVLTLDDVEVSEATRQFMADVVSVEFSSPDLVDVSKVNENTTVGQIKEIRGLECEYSAELTEDQIAEINGKEVESGDWALISMRAFDTEESLRVTMTDGEVFTIRVTDAQISKTVIDAKGDTWEITVIYGDDAQIPEDAELEAWEILPEDKAKDANDPGSGSPLSYDEYVSKAEDALGWDEGSSSYVRLFDISIVKKDDHTVRYQPAAGTTVDVHIELADSSSDVLNIVHFADENAGGDVVDAETSGQAVSFEADGFSVYAVVDGPGAIPIGWHKIESLDDLVSHTGGLYIGHINGYYFTNTLNTDSSGRTGIVKTTPAQSSPPTDRAALYYFESAGEGKYYIYCMNGSTKQYVKNENNNSLKFADDESDKTAFDVNLNNGVVTIHNGNWYWNMQSGNKGTRFCSWSDANDVNAKMNLWYYDEITDDPYGLNGKSYGLMTWNGGKTAKAMMAAENGTEDDHDRSCLEAKFLTVMTKNEGTRDKLYVPNNTADTVTMWTFEWQEDDIYYVKGTDSSGSVKYLSITADGLSLADSPDDGSCRIRVMPGSEGVHKGQICLKSAGDGTTLTYSNKYAQGFNVGGEAGLEWLYLVEEKPEDMLSDYEKVNTATKVSISDTVKVHDGQYVIIYTRQWKNDHYEYYALNGSGGLVPCEESGNSIEWIGSNLNDMLWEFTEYKDETTGDPNGYYELKNLYAESKDDPCYLAPKYSAAGTLQGIMSDKTVGLLMEGRRNQQYYSTIAAWDNPEYMYSSLLVDLNEADPAVKPCVRKDGLDFYFAIMDPLPVDDEIHTVPTIDNNQYGIKMRMIDLSNGPTNDANGQMNKFLGNTTANGMTFKHTPGLLSTNLVNGYPTATGGSQQSLDELFKAGESTDANHLFIESTYQATGYYEYNSAQNYAYMKDNGDFVVYQELGTNDTQSKITLKHGQFFPYNDIKPGRFAASNSENLYSATGQELPDTDPRKHEQLYLVEGTTDYYYAMELEASFIQTPSGLDAWGHDIIFEFSGDDDFWLYVDDELVIDLGGIHSAVPGSVNFRTGKVNVNGQNTTLRDLFYNNYIKRGHTEAEAQAYVDSKFTQNSSVFKDNTQHTMRIFYMERGAGASNLHMKFNLAAVKKDTVQLHKEIDGIDSSDSSYAVFPYQIFYTMENKPEEVRMLRNAFAKDSVSEEYTRLFGSPDPADYVYFEGGTQPVPFLPELKVGGATYYNVFMLKPDETAEITFPSYKDDAGEPYTVDKYKIVECGIDPDVYTEVRVNGVTVDGVQNIDNNDVCDYGIGMETTKARPKVNYVNKVQSVQPLEFVKELYKRFDEDSAPIKIIPYDESGNPIEHSENPNILDSDLATARKARFNFRLYLKAPFDEDFEAAGLYTYHVKDPAGYYCKWSSKENAFVRIKNAEAQYPDGTKEFEQLTKDYKDENGQVVHQDRFLASFETGPYGTISGIPAYYTIEIRNLVPGTEYKIVERPGETPEGYRFWQYEKNDAGKNTVIHTDTDPYNPMNGIAGTIKPDGKSEAWVRNYKGYEMLLKKTWEDASTIKERDPAYFAVYKVNSDGYPVDLVPGSVRELAYDAKPQELHWWYRLLPLADTTLADYSIFEVVLSGDYTVGNDGTVAVDQSNVRPILDGSLNTFNGKLNGQDEEKQIVYTVTYDVKDVPEDVNNVLIVNANNAPAELPPVQFIKRAWNNDPLQGAVFSLQYGDNHASVFDTETRTSDVNGLIGKVYLQENVEYTLTEMTAPQGYIGLDRQLTVELVKTESSGWTLNVSPEIPTGYPVDYEVTELEGILTLIVRNRPYELEMIKVDSTNNSVRLSGAEFSLLRQITIGEHQTWDEEHPVFTGLTTDVNGVIPNIDRNLPAGTYQLRETKAPGGYKLLDRHVDFTVTQQGVVELGEHPAGVELTTATDDSTGKRTYAVSIPNHPLPLKIKKTDANGTNLPGAKFQLTTLNSNNVWVSLRDKDNNELYNLIDMTTLFEYELNDLPAGRYKLTEKIAPEGYIIRMKDVYFTIAADRTVTLTGADGTGDNPNVDASVSRDSTTSVYTITVKNNAGAELPKAGGSGTRPYTVLGSILILGAGVLLWRRRRTI